jgi:hypothetical protein
MHRKTAIAAALVAVLVGSLRGPGRESILLAAEDPHAYFTALSRRSDVWRSFSLRDPAQLAGRAWVTYDPGTDTDRRKQDAAKVVVPAFFRTAALGRAVSSDDSVLTLDAAYRPLYPADRVIKVDREIMTVVSWLSDTTVSVKRGAYGSARAPHSAGADLLHSTNSLQSEVRLPLGTEDGHDYFFVWDTYWTDSYLGAGKFNHKAFQFSSGGRDGDTTWLQPQVSYYGDNHPTCWDPSTKVAAFSVRSMNRVGGGANWSSTDGNTLGPLATTNNPLDPRGEFCISPNSWVRFFVHIRQKANDYDPVDMWVADETHDAVRVLTGAPVSVRPDGGTPNSIAKFWIEFNSSETELFRLDNRELVAYVRNFVALKDVYDPRSLLVRPTPGAAPVPGPAAPKNVRILGGS